MKIKNFRDLEIWKLGKTIVLDVYQVTAKFPQSETFGIASQIKRSSVSIVSNIAEGFNRYHNKEYRQLLYIALGSCAELETQIEISGELGFIRPEEKSDILKMIDHESRMIRNLIKKLVDH